MSKNFLITNNLGGYLWYTKTPLSRYQGWFLPFNGRMLKIIDSFEGDIDTLSFPQFINALSIHNKKKTSFRIVFDIRESYHNGQGNSRTFTIYEKEGILWVRYSLEPLLIGMKIEGEYQVIDQWIKRAYPFDESRNSPPFALWVYKGLEVDALSCIIAAGKDESAVQEEIKRCQDRKREPLREIDVHDPLKVATESMLSLRVYDEARTLRGMYAGLPWFFQFWIRDNAIAAKALAVIQPEETRRFLGLLYDEIDAHDPAYLDLKGNFSGLKGTDGRLFLQWQLKELEICGGFEEHFNDKFIYNNAKETWMDTIGRTGARLEVQSLKLALLRESNMEDLFHKKVREHFLEKGILVDGITYDGTKDMTKRPNIFLAAYIYPELLSQEEWEYTIDRHLEALWLPWGGLSTIDKAHTNFHPHHTGEVHFQGEHNSPASYHQGDSWFWINNIAAMVMSRINEPKYHTYIRKIFHASTRDLTQKAIIGQASELSFASSFKPTASPVQLWSASTYIELYKELME